MNTHRTLYGPGGAPREMRASEPQIRTGKYTVADSTTDGDTTTIGGSGVCNAKRGVRQDAEDNCGTSVLNLPVYMAVGG